MKLFSYILIILFTVTGCASEGGKTYSNPIDVPFGDPYVICGDDGVFYMYGTSGEDGFRAYSSTDMVNWTDRGLVYEKSEESWGVDCFWAPEVYFRNGKYYIVYSSNWKENPNNELEIFRIGIAESDSPVGPFKDMKDAPLWDPGYPVIDGNLLFDEDGRVYMYYSRCCYKHSVESEVSQWAKDEGLYSEIEESWVYVVELEKDLSGVISEPICVLRPPVSMSDEQSEWESRSVTSREVNRRWTEGSYIIKEDGVYYIMYSANFYGGANYAVGYATATNPLGPFTKADNNPVLQKNAESGVTGTGHNSVVKLNNGKMYCVYHGRTEKTGDQRVVFIDEMGITDGKLWVNGPTTSAQPMPN